VVVTRVKHLVSLEAPVAFTRIVFEMLYHVEGRRHPRHVSASAGSTRAHRR